MGHGCTYAPHVISQVFRRGTDCAACGKPWGREPEPDPPPVLQQVTPNNGPAAGGQGVVVQCSPGHTLIDATAVLFDETPGTNLRGGNPTQRIVDTPAHDEGPVQVVVVTPRGTSQNAVQYFYNA